MANETSGHKHVHRHIHRSHGRNYGSVDGHISIHVHVHKEIGANGELVTERDRTTSWTGSVDAAHEVVSKDGKRGIEHTAFTPAEDSPWSEWVKPTKDGEEGAHSSVDTTKSSKKWSESALSSRKSSHSSSEHSH